MFNGSEPLEIQIKKLKTIQTNLIKDVFDNGSLSPDDTQSSIDSILIASSDLTKGHSKDEFAKEEFGSNKSTGEEKSCLSRSDSQVSNLIPLEHTKTETIKSPSEFKLNVNEVLMKEIKRMGKTLDLNESEKIVLTTLRSRRDNIYISMDNTSKNKELIYLINAFERINVNDQRTQVIILQPTADLVQKVGILAIDLFKNTSIKVRVSTIGNPICHEDQIKDHILICTVKVLLMLAGRNSSRLELANTQIIFDEFDVLISFSEMEGLIQKLLKKLDRHNQFVFYCLNLSINFQRYIQKYTKDKLIDLGQLGRDDFYVKNVMHFFVQCEELFKRGLLVKFLNNIKKSTRVVIFTVGGKIGNEIYDLLTASGFENVERVFGTTFDVKKSPVQERQEAVSRFNTFSSDKISILISNFPLLTNIDLVDVDVLVNFNMPKFGTVVSEYASKLRVFDFRSKKPKFVVNFFNKRHNEDKKISILVRNKIRPLKLKIQN